MFVRLYGEVQSIDVIRYRDEEYDKYLTDPVYINLRLQFLFLFFIFGLTENSESR